MNPQTTSKPPINQLSFFTISVASRPISPTKEKHRTYKQSNFASSQLPWHLLPFRRRLWRFTSFLLQQRRRQTCSIAGQDDRSRVDFSFYRKLSGFDSQLGLRWRTISCIVPPDLLDFQHLNALELEDATTSSSYLPYSMLLTQGMKSVEKSVLMSYYLFTATLGLLPITSGSVYLRLGTRQDPTWAV